MKNPWAYVRATTELPFDKKADQQLPYFDDVTVRAATEVIDLEPGKKLTQSYLIYNGPSKVRLLGLMEGDRTVDPELVERYQDGLGLQTITDFRSETWLGRFANSIYWTDLVIAFTNLMHWLLASIHMVMPSWALCIVVLTVMVRLLLIYPSKKQTQMNQKMMDVQKKLAPQIEELKKKYADNPHEFNRAKMQLMMANGVNPFAAMGGCLLLIAQMPMMMGLYFCLQESVFFRLEPFLWVNNLAAPDMLIWWGEHIPYISTPEDLGSFIYLGPYFNVLPIVAVALMIWQQNKMMPPPTDEQMAQQQKMMKYMMIMVAIMFYKVAAGLALYFIIGSAWGLIERRLIPKASDKKKAEEGAASAESSTTTTVQTSAGAVEVPKPKRLSGPTCKRGTSRRRWRRCSARPTRTQNVRFATRRTGRTTTRIVATTTAATGRRNGGSRERSKPRAGVFGGERARLRRLRLAAYNSRDQSSRNSLWQVTHFASSAVTIFTSSLEFAPRPFFASVTSFLLNSMLSFAELLPLLGLVLAHERLLAGEVESQSR